MTPEEEIAAFNKKRGVTAPPITHSGEPIGRPAGPDNASGGADFSGMAGTPWERFKTLFGGALPEGSDPSLGQPVDQGGDLDAMGTFGAKALDTATMGALPWAKDKLAEATGQPSNMRERIRQGAEEHPWAAAGGTATGAAPLLAAGTAGIVSGARSLGIPWLARAGMAPMAMTGALAGGGVSIADQAARANLTEENHDFNWPKTGFDAAVGAGGGALGSAIQRFARPVYSAIRSRIDPTTTLLPRNVPDPTGTIPPVALTGPEAMRTAGLPAGQVQQAQGLLENALPRGAVTPTEAARGPALARGQELRDMAIRNFEGRSVDAGEPAIRMPGAIYGVPEADPLLKMIGGTKGMPGGITNARDAGEPMLLALQNLKANRAITPPDQLPALEAQIARMEANLSQPKRAPFGVQASQATDQAQQFGQFAESLQARPPTPPPAAPSRAGPVATELGSLAADAVVPGSGTAIRLGRGLLGQNPLSPGGAPNEAIARALEDPAQLQGLLNPETFLELFKRDVPGRIVQKNLQHLGSEAVFGDRRTKRSRS